MSPKVKKQLSDFRSHFFREKYRFDQGNAFLVFLNFSMLVISLVNQSNGNQSMILWYVVMGFFGTWLLGYFLDKIVRVQEAVETESRSRSPIWRENFYHHDRHDQKIEEISAKINNIEKLLNNPK